MDIFVYGTNHSEPFGCVSHNNDCVRVRTCSVLCPVAVLDLNFSKLGTPFMVCVAIFVSYYYVCVAFNALRTCSKICRIIVPFLLTWYQTI